MGLLFENTTCTRCGGTGEHSYCRGYGSKCFKCHGKGVQLTKRGAAAQEYYNSLVTIPIEQVQAGSWLLLDVVTMSGIGRMWVEVIKIERCPEISAWHVVDGERIPIYHMELTYRTKGGRVDTEAIGYGMKHKTQPANVQELRKQALEYQETLTKAGKPRKRAIKK